MWILKSKIYTLKQRALWKITDQTIRKMLSWVSQHSLSVSFLRRESYFVIHLWAIKSIDLISTKKNYRQVHSLTWIINELITVKLFLIIRPSNFTSRYILRIECRASNKYLYTKAYKVHSSIIHNSQKVETTQMPLIRWVDIQNVINIYMEYYLA